MRVAFLVGNGFNYMVENIIRKHVTGHETPEQLIEKRAIADSIISITALWKKFDEVFQELTQQFAERGVKISHEELIRMIYAVINLFSSMSGFEQILSQDDLKRLKAVFDGFLLSKIREIASEFQDHQKTEAYGKIRNYFPTLPGSVEDMISSRQLGKVRIFTTNYDGVLDTIFTKRPYGFMFSDGFIKSPSYHDLLELEPSYVTGNDLILAHIHGSYRFTKRYGKTYKTRENTDNREPVMVFNNPNMKEEIVKGDNVLSEYYKAMQQTLFKADKLVILGNSMEAEPHFKKIIKKYFDRPGTSITVSSRSPDSVKEQIKPFYKQQIHEVSTRGVNSEEDLIELFDNFLTV